MVRSASRNEDRLDAGLVRRVAAQVPPPKRKSICVRLFVRIVARRGTTMRKTIVIFFVLLLAIAFGCNRAKPGGKKLTIAVIPKGTSHEFWKSIHAGAVKAARELSTPGAEVE